MRDDSPTVRQPLDAARYLWRMPRAARHRVPLRDAARLPGTVTQSAASVPYPIPEPHPIPRAATHARLSGNTPRFPRSWLLPQLRPPVQYHGNRCILRASLSHEDQELLSIWADIVVRQIVGIGTF